MIIKNTLISLTITILVSACGIKKNQMNENVDQETKPTNIKHFTNDEKETLTKEFSSIPQGLIYKVPLDKNGKELTGQTEVRSYNGQEVSENQVNEQLWNQSVKSSNIDSTGKELGYLRYRRNVRRSINYYSYRTGCYYNSWACNYYPSYRSNTCYNCNWTYYAQPIFSRWGNCNYYYYQRPASPIYW